MADVRHHGRVAVLKPGRVVAVTILLLVVALAFPVYHRLGWWRMETHCSAEPPGKAPFREVQLSFTKQGFTCVYDHGQWTETSYWFG